MERGGIALGVYCWLAENQASLLWQTIVRLLWFYLGTRGFRKMLWGLPPIHFGREEGVERTLLRGACQSETFLVPPWQGDANIRFLWHIGCQSDFDELFSLASRPVDRGFCRMEETKEHPTPNKDTLPKQRHPTQTTNHAQTRTPHPNKNTLPKHRHPTQTTNHAQTRTSRPNQDILPKPGHPPERSGLENFC